MKSYSMCTPGIFSSHKMAITIVSAWRAAGRLAGPSIPVTTRDHPSHHLGTGNDLWIEVANA
jgi:hypothetical protein